MIRHIVLTRLRPDVPEADRQAVFDALAALQSVTPIRHFACNADSSPEGMNRGYSHAFTMDFDTVADRDAYLAHPAHQAAGANLVAATDGGADGLLVIDIEV